MRMRKKKHGAERIRACAELLIEDPLSLYADPKAPFKERDRRLCLEIGCGKGDFAVGMAERNRTDNFIAIERVPDVCCAALEKAMACKESRDDNLRFVIGNADHLEEWFPPKSIDVIYLNFSDPWPKAGHAKRRLTHRGYLEKYRRLLRDGGALIFKTDNVGLFDFTLSELDELGLDIVWSTRDLHNSERAESNVMTEYERNFSQKGFPICCVEVRFDVCR